MEKNIPVVTWMKKSNSIFLIIISDLVTIRNFFYLIFLLFVMAILFLGKLMLSQYFNMIGLNPIGAIITLIIFLLMIKSLKFVIETNLRNRTIYRLIINGFDRSLIIGNIIISVTFIAMSFYLTLRFLESIFHYQLPANDPEFFQLRFAPVTILAEIINFFYVLLMAFWISSAWVGHYPNKDKNGKISYDLYIFIYICIILCVAVVMKMGMNTGLRPIYNYFEIENMVLAVALVEIISLWIIAPIVYSVEYCAGLKRWSQVSQDWLDEQADPYLKEKLFKEIQENRDV